MADKGGNFELPTYDFGHKYRGCAIVIVNKDFWQDGKKVKESTRHGSEVDLKKMRELFKALDFKVKLYKNLTAEKMKEKILKASTNKEINQNSDCFALVISSHGEEVEEKKIPYMPPNAKVWRHRVLGSDCNPVYIDNTIEYFEDDKAKGLAGKPKLFFIQACRSSVRGKNKYDYGVDVNVVVPDDLAGSQPSDAGDHVDKSVLEAFTSFEDVNRDWADDDEDEWKSDDEADTSDDDAESVIDSDEDLSDAKGDPDSGYMPPSPVGYVPPSSAHNMPPSQDSGNIQPSQDSGNTPELGLPQPVFPAKDDKVVSSLIGQPRAGDVSQPSNTPQDMADANPGVDSNTLPPSPFDIVPIKCPNDCLLVYPVTSGFFSFRRADIGSRLLHCMHKPENLHNLLKGSNLLQYLTQVCGDMSRVEISFEPNKKEYTVKQIAELKKNMPFKVSTIVLHRLTKQVVFEPKLKRSFMAVVMDSFRKMFL